MPHIAPETFVPAVARQRHRDVTPGQLGHQQRRDLRFVGERLVPDMRQVGDDGPGVGSGHAEGRVLGPQIARDPGGVVALIIPGLAEADGERTHRARRLRLHQGHHQGAVDAA